MARRLRMIGTTSDDGNCPTLYEDLESGEIIVQGYTVTDAADVAQLARRGVVRRRPSRAALPFRAEGVADVANLVPFEDITDLFSTFRHTAWRLESRRGYAVDVGNPKWQLWQAGGGLGYNPQHPWHANVRAQTGQGKRIERVRVVDDPPTVEQRFLLAGAVGNVEAGEDIRNVWRSDAQRTDLPCEDFWLFDSRLLVRLVFGEADVTVGVEVAEDPAEVVAACQVRDAAWHVAIRTTEFAARVPSQM